MSYVIVAVCGIILGMWFHHHLNKPSPDYTTQTDTQGNILPDLTDNELGDPFIS